MPAHGLMASTRCSAEKVLPTAVEVFFIPRNGIQVLAAIYSPLSVGTFRFDESIVSQREGKSRMEDCIHVDKYFEQYEGYISSHDYKRANDAALAALARHIRDEADE